MFKYWPSVSASQVCCGFFPAHRVARPVDTCIAAELAGQHSRVSFDRHRLNGQPASHEANITPSKGLVPIELQEYVTQHTKLSQVQQRLRDRTKADWPKVSHMMVPTDEGSFLTWLVAALGCRKALEVGTFTGYSALSIAQALPADGHLICCEQDKRPLDLAREMWQQAGVLQKIEISHGPAVNTLQQLVDAGQSDTLDFAFIDADKRGNSSYYNLLLKLVRVGGVIAVDNVLWYGRVAYDEDKTPKTIAIRQFNKQVLEDQRVHASLQTIGDGMLLIRRLQ